MVAFPHPTRTTRSLADAAPGDLVEVGLIAFDFVRTACWHLAIRPGEVLQCLGSRSDSVLAARPDGTRVRVPAECARFIGVRRLEGHLDVHGPAAAAGAGAAETRPSVQ